MNIIVIGCGHVGSRLAEALSLAGHAVTVVDRDGDAFGRLGPTFKGRQVTGVGFDSAVLSEAGIRRADALAALTGSDEANIVSARIARQVFHVPRVVALLNDPLKAEIYHRLGLQCISPISWTVKHIGELLSYSPLEPVVSLGGGAVELVSVEIPALLAGHRVEEVLLPGEVQVVALSRDGQTFLPGPKTIFQHGDSAHVILRAGSTAQLKALLGLG